MQDKNKAQRSEKGETNNSWQTPGIILRKARRERKLDEEGVCKVLGLSVSSLKALESDDFERLPAQVYVRGYIRSYCSLLAIAEQPVLDCYGKYCLQLEQNEKKALNEDILPVSTSIWKKPIIWGLTAAVIIVVIFLLV